MKTPAGAFSASHLFGKITRVSLTTSFPSFIRGNRSVQRALLLLTALPTPCRVSTNDDSMVVSLFDSRNPSSANLQQMRMPLALRIDNGSARCLIAR